MNTIDIYFDFEFIDDGREIVPISLGMCTDQPTEQLLCEEARKLTSYAHLDPSPAELYLEYRFDTARANDWVRENVFPHLSQGEMRGVNGECRSHAARLIREWVASVCGDKKPRFWGYYPSYDWVCLCQHFGTMMQGPEGWPIRPECLMQLADHLGVMKSTFPQQPADAHNALADAQWNRALHIHLKTGTAEGRRFPYIPPEFAALEAESDEDEYDGDELE